MMMILSSSSSTLQASTRESLSLPSSCKDVGAGASAGASVGASVGAGSKAGAKTNPSIAHVKAYAKKHNISYGDAISKARPSYK